MVSNLFNTVVRYIANSMSLGYSKFDVNIVVAYAVPDNGRTRRQSPNDICTEGGKLHQDSLSTLRCLNYLRCGFALVSFKSETMLPGHFLLMQKLRKGTVGYYESSHRSLEKGLSVLTDYELIGITNLIDAVGRVKH